MFRLNLHTRWPLTALAWLWLLSCNSSGFSGQNASNKNQQEKSKDNKTCDSAPKGKSGSKAKRKLALQDSGAACAISANGEQAYPGVYAVVLTNPAPCDFRLPHVTITSFAILGFGGDKVTLPIGSYWTDTSFFDGEKAHEFATGAEPANVPRIDNGFLLVQPDGKTYLLADAGMAHRSNPMFKPTSEIANQLSQTLGFGPTELLQPDPGSEADNYATATVFKKGSVIAVYDDTPDMAGGIEVAALVEDFTEVDDSTGSTPGDGPGADNKGGGHDTIDDLPGSKDADANNKASKDKAPKGENCD